MVHWDGVSVILLCISAGLGMLLSLALSFGLVCFTAFLIGRHSFARFNLLSLYWSLSSTSSLLWLDANTLYT